MTPDQAVTELVERVYSSSTTKDPERLRKALRDVLVDLEVDPADPAWTDGRDIVGAAYERLLPGHQRRILGQFFTPLGIARVMARWLLAEPRRLLLDPGCGSGSLLVAAAQEDKHGTQLLGLDIDPHAIAMAQANRRIRRIDRLELRCANFLIDERNEQPDAIICNPPYTRHHELSSFEKERIYARLERAFDVTFSRLASLHVLFLVRALEISSPDALLAFVTPSNWLDMSYAREIKRLLLERAHVEAIINFPADVLVFPHAHTTAAITLIRKGVSGRDAGPTRLIQAQGKTTTAIAAAATSDGEPVVLGVKRKWSRPTPPNRTGIRLEEVARVRRGVATGSNRFFVLSERARRDLGISRSSCRPCLASPRLFEGTHIDSETLEALPLTARRWLITPKRERATGPIANYLARGKSEFGVHEGYLVRQRVKAGRKWYEVEANVRAPILFTYLNRRGARFVRNLADAVPLNNWLIIDPLDHVDSDALLTVLSSKKVKSRLQDDCRVYGNGMWKLEPGELKQLMLPVTAGELRIR